MTPERDDYLNRLARELAGAGIRGARRRRILDEFADHLACDPDAGLGDPRALATQFADELGTSFARRAALSAFAALAVTGAVLVARLLSMGQFNRIDGSAADTLGILAAVIAAQVAFAAGTLGLLRAWRLRGESRIPAAEAKILARRAGVGLVAGALATAAVPLRAVASPHVTSGPSWLSGAAVAVALGALLLAVPAVIQSARLRPSAAGPAADLMADLGPLSKPLVSPTRIALLLAGAMLVFLAVTGIMADDPYDGILRGLMEGGACLAGFAALGRYLGLRR